MASCHTWNKSRTTPAGCQGFCNQVPRTSPASALTTPTLCRAVACTAHPAPSPCPWSCCWDVLCQLHTVHCSPPSVTCSDVTCPAGLLWPPVVVPVYPSWLSCSSPERALITTWSQFNLLLSACFHLVNVSSMGQELGPPRSSLYPQFLEQCLQHWRFSITAWISQFYHVLWCPFTVSSSFSFHKYWASGMKWNQGAVVHSREF